MLNIRVKNIIAILFALLLAVQFVPGTSENNECLVQCCQESYFANLDNIEYTDLALFEQDERKIRYGSISMENCIFSFGHNHFTHIFETKSIYHSVPVDRRKAIQRVNAQYFHEGKYKQSSLFI